MFGPKIWILVLFLFFSIRRIAHTLSLPTHRPVLGRVRMNTWPYQQGHETVHLWEFGDREQTMGLSATGCRAAEGGLWRWRWNGHFHNASTRISARVWVAWCCCPASCRTTAAAASTRERKRETSATTTASVWDRMLPIARRCCFWTNCGLECSSGGNGTCRMQNLSLAISVGVHRNVLISEYCISPSTGSGNGQQSSWLWDSREWCSGRT